MGEVTGKEPSVRIENVNLFINVIKIENVDVAQAATPADFLPAVVEGEGSIISLEDPLLDVSGAHQEWVQASEDPTVGPLGWIADYGGNVIPFGVQPIAMEVPGFGDKKTWKEIRVCLPPSLFVDNESDLYCPVASCREKLPKNKSMDFHIKKHLGLSEHPQNSNTANQASLPCPLFYYCQDKSCQYNVKSAEKSFKGFKNVKQHYIKVHAPRLFECDMCQKTFSKLKFAETHKLMCGEKYSCSTCNSSYNSLEALQTHCRRKVHAYDHSKYKDKKNSVKQELQMQYPKTVALPPQHLPAATMGTTGGRKHKIGRRLPAIRPKVQSSDEVFNSIQALCRQAGVKVDYGCQTVCSAFLQKGDPIEAVVTSPTTSFSKKKRKTTDTQTNIVKFRATCLDQRHNATNTNKDWKTVVTSDSQTQTAESEPELSCPKSAEAARFNSEFATIKISETAQQTEVDVAVSVDDLTCPEIMRSELSLGSDTFDSPNNIPDNESAEVISDPTSSPIVKDEIGPSFLEEFISFLEATDSATQTDPDMFKMSGGDCLGINVNLDNIFGNEQDVYVSVSSTASQTAVESVSSKSLSAEDYEALLNAADERRLADLQVFSDYIKTVEGIGSSKKVVPNGTEQNDEELSFDWENLVDDVYQEEELQTKNSQP